ncbi:MAG: hypothetical protein ACLQO7_13935 [Candidatus Bathyarchaeia archaeon]
MHAERAGEYAGKDELFFDVNAKLEEQKKGTNEVLLNFELAISTKPNVVKYNIAGNVSLMGKPDDIKKKLEVNPKTKIPQLLFTIYQHVFNSIYMLSANLNTPYPPPDLLHPMAEKIQIISGPPQNSSATEKTESVVPPAASAQSPQPSASAQPTKKEAAPK